MTAVATRPPARLAEAQKLLSLAAGAGACRELRPERGAVDWFAGGAGTGSRRWMGTGRTIRPICRCCWRRATVRATGQSAAGHGIPQVAAGHWLKRISSRVANGVRSRLLGDATPDTGCGLKLILRSTYPGSAVLRSHAPLPACAGPAQRRRDAVGRRAPPPARARASNYGMLDRLWVGIVDLFGVMWLRRRMQRPGTTS